MIKYLVVRARCSPGSKVPSYRSSNLNGESKVLTPRARCPVIGLRTLMVRARCSPQEQCARLLVFGPQRSKVPSYRSSDLNGESKVLIPGARCPVTCLRILMVRAMCSPREQGGSALGFATVSAVGPVEAPAADSEACSSGTLQKGVGPESGTSSGSTTRSFGRSSSSTKASKAAPTSFCIARRPLVKAHVPNLHIRSSPMGVRETAARNASPRRMRSVVSGGLELRIGVLLGRPEDIILVKDLAEVPSRLNAEETHPSGCFGDRGDREEILEQFQHHRETVVTTYLWKHAGCSERWERSVRAASHNTS
nr:hypothetical protein Iba_chr14fCG7140 [Ipomoea batatas]